MTGLYILLLIPAFLLIGDYLMELWDKWKEDSE